MWDNIPNQPTKFKTKKRTEINEDSHGTYSTNSQIKFKISMLKSSLCGCYNPYLLASGTMAVAELAAGRGNKNINVACR